MSSATCADSVILTTWRHFNLMNHPLLRRSFFVYSALLGALSMFGFAPAEAADHPVYVWTEASFSDADPANDNYDWNNPANWDCAGLPGVPPKNAIVRIASGTPQATGTVHTFHLEITGGSFRAEELRLENLSMQDGAIFGTNVEILPNGVGTWTGGMISGEWRILPGAKLKSSGAEQKFFAATLLNQGTVEYVGEGWDVDASASITNLAGGVFDIQRDGDFVRSSAGISLFINLDGALLEKSVGTGATRLNGFRFRNFGEMRADSGILNGSVAIYDGSVFSGFGRIEPGSGFMGGNVLVSNAVLGVNGVWLDEGTELTFSTAGSGIVEWVSGMLRGTFNIAPGSRMDLVSDLPKEFNNGSVLNNRGHLNWNGPGSLNATWGGPVTINNMTGGVFSLNSSGELVDGPDYSCVLNNEAGARLIKTSGTGTVHITKWVFNQAGESRVEEGVIAYTTTVNISDGALFSGPGTHLFAGGGTSLLGAMNVYESVASFQGTSMTAAGTNALFVTRANGLVEWNNALLTGVFNVSTGSMVKLTGNQAIGWPRVEINNLGRVTFSENARIGEYDNGDARVIWNNLPGGRVDFATDGSVFPFDESYRSVLFTNHVGAVVAKTAGTGTTIFRTGAFENSGLVSATSGTLNIAGPSRWSDGSGAGGSGEVRLANGTAVFEGTVTVSGGVFSLGDDQIFVRLRGIGDLAKIQTANNGVFEWRSGEIDGALTLLPASKIRTVGTGSKWLSPTAQLNNHGVWDWLTAQPVETYSSTDVAFNNLASGTINVYSNMVLRKAFYSYWPACHLSNSGTISFFGGGKLFVDWWDVYLAPTSRLHLYLDAMGTNAREPLNVPYWDLTLDGTLAVSFSNNAPISNGAMFRVANYGRRLGEFKDTTLPALPIGSHWRVDYGDLPSGTNNHTVALFVEGTGISEQQMMTNGHYQFRFTAEPGGVCVIDTSEDLETWKAIHTNAPFAGALTFEDAETQTYTNRFYRVRLEQ